MLNLDQSVFYSREFWTPKIGRLWRIKYAVVTWISDSLCRPCPRPLTPHHKTPQLAGRLKREQTDKIKGEISLFTLIRRKNSVLAELYNYFIWLIGLTPFSASSFPVLEKLSFSQGLILLTTEKQNPLFWAAWCTSTFPHAERKVAIKTSQTPMLSAGLGASGNADSALSETPVIHVLWPSMNSLNCFASLTNLSALTTWAKKVFPGREKN